MLYRPTICRELFRYDSLMPANYRKIMAENYCATLGQHCFLSLVNKNCTPFFPSGTYSWCECLCEKQSPSNLAWTLQTKGKNRYATDIPGLVDRYELPTVDCKITVKDLAKCQPAYQPSADRRRPRTVYPAEALDDRDLTCRQSVNWHVDQVSADMSTDTGGECVLSTDTRAPKAHINVNKVNYLRIFTLLSNNDYILQAVPLSRQSHLLELAISRLQDKSSIVRKNAIQLLKTCLICNPFGAQVSSCQNAGSFQEIIILLLTGNLSLVNRG